MEWEEGKGLAWRVAYLDEKSAVVKGEGCKDVLKDFAESGTVDTCHTRREPGFTNSPALNAQMDPRATCNKNPQMSILPHPVHQYKKTGSRPSTSPSMYCGRKADMNAERWEESAACVCSIPNEGSCTRSFCSTVCNCVMSSSSSDEAAAVF